MREQRRDGGIIDVLDGAAGKCEDLETGAAVEGLEADRDLKIAGGKLGEIQPAAGFHY